MFCTYSQIIYVLPLQRRSKALPFPNLVFKDPKALSLPMHSTCSVSKRNALLEVETEKQRAL